MFDLLMTAMKSILCITDLRESAVNVLTMAANMAMPERAHITILFPYRLIAKNFSGDLADVRKEMELEALETFQELKGKVDGLQLLSHDFSTEIGFAIDRIKTHLRSSQVDMIVIGQQQLNDSSANSLRDLVGNLQVPILIIPET